MATMSIVQRASPYRTLTITFVAWKILLLAIAAGSQVGPLYDTSSSLLTLSHAHDDNKTPLRDLITRLCSWDAIYFIKNAQRGYLFEQEWAFGSALPACIALVTRALTVLGLVDASSIDNEGAAAHLAALIGVLITHGCHFLSTLVLYQLGLHIWADATWALVSALLHVLSPAGIFLSAPYQESPFSLLSFVGWLLLVKSCLGPQSILKDVLTILAGVSFGLATVFRTNGLLNGAPFALEFLFTLYRLVEDLEPRTSAIHIRRLAILGVSGLFVAAGSVVPQSFAYKIYCWGRDGGDPGIRPWCLNFVPSIYGFVQREYWNTGFLRYWTISNAPLFLLAAPMLFVMGKGGKDVFFQAGKISQTQPSGPNMDNVRLRLVVRSMAFVQMLLVGLTLTSYHVQIITRLSSGYPAWYWWVAACLKSPKTRQMGTGLVVFMVMYALIQTVLFASFLPPA